MTSDKGEVALADWQFNAWAKYPNWQRDNAVSEQIRRLLRIRAWRPRRGRRRLVLEGGSIDVDGRGLLLTTEECLLSPVQARNPGLGRVELEKAFADYLSVRIVLWLGEGIAGDDTHGHIDDLARFVAPGKVVAAVEEDPTDINYQPLQKNLERLHSMTGLDGQPLKVAVLPMPRPLYFQGQRLPASYANFYIANDRVLVPTFNDPRDTEALTILAGLFPGRTVVGIHAVDLVWGLGTLHCLTQQQPLAPFKE
jgi:agmatine deiminase